MKTNITHIIVPRLLTSGALVMSLLGVAGCHCTTKLVRTNEVGCRSCLAVHSTNGVCAASGPKTEPGSTDSTQPSGLLVRSGCIQVTAESDSPDSDKPAINEDASKIDLSPNTVANDKPEFHSAETISVHPSDPIFASITARSSRRSAPKQVEPELKPVASEPEPLDSAKEISREKSPSPMLVPQTSELDQREEDLALLKREMASLDKSPPTQLLENQTREPLRPILGSENTSPPPRLNGSATADSAKIEPLATAAKKDQSPALLTESKRAPASQVSPPSTTDTNLASITQHSSRDSSMKDSDSVLEEPNLQNSHRSKAPTSLPRASAGSFLKRFDQAVERPRLASPTPVATPPVQQSESREQPLEMKIGFGPWPGSEIDPVARAYDQFRAEKSSQTYGNWDSGNTTVPQSPDQVGLTDHPGRPDQGGRRTPGQLVGHRRDLDDSQALDPAALAHDQSNWITHSNKVPTGLTLHASPQSANVALAPLVTLTPGFADVQYVPQNLPRDSQTEPDNAPVEPRLHESEDLQPRFWPSIPDSRQLLPIDEVGPIFDLPASDEIRRLSVRPSDQESQPIER